MTLTAGVRLGPYEVISTLGVGGMGSVHLSRDVRLGRQVALKVLLRTESEDGNAVARFLREARAAAALNHPNIVTVFDVGEEATCRYIAMEFVRGRTLRQVMEGGTVEMRAGADLGAQMARALEVAHGAGVIHRDIKPENVMVRADGLVKVLDFGIARMFTPSEVEAAENPTGLTAPGLVLGTARYMSPEQAFGDPVSAPSDIFALGVVLYELLTGVYPFLASSRMGLLRAIAADEPGIPSDRRANLPPAIDELLLAMMAKEPAARPDAAHVGRALASMAAGTLGVRAIAAAPTSADRNTVGRERERTVLRTAFEAAAAGRGGFLSLAGEAGAGKTTLVDDFLAEVSSQSACLAARAGCSERLAGGEAYLPLLDAIDGLLRDDTARRIARALRTFAPAWDAWVSGQESAGPGLPPERLKRELVAFLEEASQARPLVLVLDDLHWADTPTVDFLAYLLPRLGSLRLLLLVTYRASEMLLVKHPFVEIERDFVARGAGRVLALPELTREETAEFVDRQFPGHRFPTDFLDMVHTKTGGTPLFLVNVLRYLREEAVIEPVEDGWELAAAVPNIERDLPPSVLSMIRRKIDQLEEPDRRLMAAASVQGFEFDSAAVAAVLEADAADVEEALNRLDTVNAFVRRIEDQELTDGTLSVRYRFAHVLYQNVLFGALPPTRRSRLSGAVARTLARLHGARSVEMAAELALLFETAHEFDSAAAHFTIAANRASAVFAHEQAVAYARRGLTLLGRLPENADRAALEIDLLIPLAHALRTLRGYTSAEAGEHLQRARKLCAPFGNTPERGVILYYVSSAHTVAGELRLARETAEEAAQVANATEDDYMALGASFVLGIAAFHSGDILEAHRLFEPSITEFEHLDGLKVKQLFRFDVRAYMRAEYVRILWLFGRDAEAGDSIQRLLDAAQSVPDGHLAVAFALVFRSFLAQLRGDTEDALRWSEVGIAHCEEHGIAQEREWAVPVRGWALALLGNVEEGTRIIRESIEAQREMGAQLVFPYYYVLMSDAFMAGDQLAEAGKALKEAKRLEEATGQRFYEAGRLTMSGKLRLREAAGPPLEDAAAIQEAARHFMRAIEVARSQGTRALELRAALALARLAPMGNGGSNARRLLSECVAAYPSGSGDKALEEALSVLAAPS